MARQKVYVFIVGIPHNWWDWVWDYMIEVLSKQPEVLWIHNFEIGKITDNPIPSVEIKLIPANGTQIRQTILWDLENLISFYFPDYLVNISLGSIDD